MVSLHSVTYTVTIIVGLLQYPLKFFHSKNAMVTHDIHVRYVVVLEM